MEELLVISFKLVPLIVKLRIINISCVEVVLDGGSTCNRGKPFPLPYRTLVESLIVFVRL